MGLHSTDINQVTENQFKGEKKKYKEKRTGNNDIISFFVWNFSDKKHANSMALKITEFIRFLTILPLSFYFYRFIFSIFLYLVFFFHSCLVPKPDGYIYIQYNLHCISIHLYVYTPKCMNTHTQFF